MPLEILGGTLLLLSCPRLVRSKLGKSSVSLIISAPLVLKKGLDRSSQGIRMFPLLSFSTLNAGEESTAHILVSPW